MELHHHTRQQFTEFKSGPETAKEGGIVAHGIESDYDLE